MRILLMYATQHQSTEEVATFIANILTVAGLDVTLANSLTYEGTLEGYDGYIFGTGIYKGMWLHNLLEKIRHGVAEIGDKPVWGFGMCIRVLEPDGELYARNNYLPEAVLKKLNLRDFQFFAGKLLMEEIDFQERWTLSIRYDGKESHSNFNGDYRNWDIIRAWANQIAKDAIPSQVP